MSNPTNPPAAPSRPYDDARIAAARNTLAESARAQAPDTADDRSAAYWWSRCEGAALNVLAVIDEGKTLAPDDVEALSDDELYDRLDAQIDVMQPLVDELKRRRESQS